MRQILLVQSPQSVRLVPAAIYSFENLIAAAIFIESDSGIVSGGNKPGPQTGDLFPQSLPLHLPVADDAGIGRSSSLIFVNEILDDLPFEFLFEIQDVVRRIYLLADCPSIVDHLQATAD